MNEFIILLGFLLILRGLRYFEAPVHRYRPSKDAPKEKRYVYPEDLTSKNKSSRHYPITKLR